MDLLWYYDWLTSYYSNIAECQIMGDRDGVHLVKTSEGRSTGECFVEMLSERDLEIALTKDHQNMGHRYIEVWSRFTSSEVTLSLPSFVWIPQVFKVKKVEMDWILKRARPNDQSSNGSSTFRGSSGGSGRGAVGGGNSFTSECETFVRLRGIPYECTEEDIEQFFSGNHFSFLLMGCEVSRIGRVVGKGSKRSFYQERFISRQ